jgi:P27 family predicted phage terminase small subunit
MARPCKPASLLTDKSQTKAEISEREAIEKKLRGDKQKIRVPKELSKRQKTIFRNIVRELEKSDILGVLDSYLLSTTAICIDRMQVMESEINEHPDLLMSANYMASKDKYTKAFFRCCNELGLSPQSRAKFANLMAAKAEDPLIKALSEADDDDDED